MAEYIERMKVISTIRSYEFGHCPEYMQDWATKLKRAILQDVVDDVMEVPAADVVAVEAEPVKHGRWETSDDPEFILKDFSCSVCKSQIFDFDTIALIPGENCYYYCPNCGAKMDKGE